MKITYNNGTVCAEAETLQEIETLLAMRGAEVGVEKKRKATYRVRECDICGKVFKKLKLHKTMFHEGKHWRNKEEKVTERKSFPEKAHLVYQTSPVV